MTVKKATHSGFSWSIILAFAAVYIFWGATFLFIRFGIETIPPFMLGGMRFLFAGTALLLISIYKKEMYNWELWRFGIITGFLMFMVSNGAVVFAEKNLTSGLVSILAGTVPFWILVFDKPSGVVRFKNKWTWVGLFFGFGGLIILFIDKLTIDISDQAKLWSYFLILIGTLAWTAGTLYSKYTFIKASTTAKVSVQTLSASAMFFISSLAIGDFKEFSWYQVSTKSWFAVFYLVTFGTLIGYFCFIWLLGKVSAHAVTTHSFVNPIVAVFLGIVFAGEKFDWNELAALLFVVAGLIALYFSKK